MPGAQGQSFQEIHGKYFTQNVSGNMFFGATASGGVVPPVCTATAQTFGLWNPAGSGVNLVMVRLSVAVVTIGVVTSGFSWSTVNPAGSAIGAAGAPITAFTATTPSSCFLKAGALAGSQVKFTASAATTVAAVYYRPINISVVNATSPTAANFFGSGMAEEYDGTFIVGPGVAVFVTNNIAGVGTYGLMAQWYEVLA